MRSSGDGVELKLSRRELRSLGIVAKGGQVTRINDGLFVVKSASGTGSYELRWDQHYQRWSCECPDAMKGTYPCKHAMVPHWTLALPVVLMSNARITSGIVSTNPDPCLFYLGRRVHVCDAVELYKLVLSRLEGFQDALPQKPPPRPTIRTPTQVGKWEL